jgi:hypothetical protein
MAKRPIILGLLAVLLVAGFIGWQVGVCYIANSELRSDMRDLAVQNSFRIGLAPLPTAEELRDSVVAKAKDHGIDLDPQQVTVQRTIDDNVLSISLAADYEAHVNLFVCSFMLHFAPSSSHTGKIEVR